jgi:exopolyphosphatase / guanosine-5'-triphosphate,3'-diphosphate pyrophosphatase
MSTSTPPLRIVLPSGDDVSPLPDRELRISAIDIGSNSIRQTIADVSSSGVIRVVDEMKAAPRLGARLDETGKLNETAIPGALEALQRMATLARQLGVKRSEVVATSAVRDASNGDEFLAAVRKSSGLIVNVLHGDDEARLALRSALAHFDMGVGRSVVMDIGGGSLELALSVDGLVDRLASLPLGAIRTTEGFLGDEPTDGDRRRLRKHVRRELRKHLSRRLWRANQMICSGGTFTSLAGIHLARAGMASAQTVHGTVITRTELEHLVDLLANMSLGERQALPGLNPARADIIVGGLSVATEVMALIEARSLVVSAYGIREGLLLETARVTPTAADPGEARERSVRELAERTHYEAPHAKHVQKLSLQLFDALRTRLRLTTEDRGLLSDAALLHDIGYHINYDKHHKHSYHLVQHADLFGVTPIEQVAIANIARYHRGAAPKKKHGNFSSLDPRLQDRIRKLSAILRVADGFDRGHANAVDSVKVRWTARALRITAVPNPRAQSVRLELWGASRKSKLLSKVAGSEVEIVAPDGEVLTYGDEEGTAD